MTEVEHLRELLRIEKAITENLTRVNSYAENFISAMAALLAGRVADLEAVCEKLDLPSEGAYLELKKNILRLREVEQLCRRPTFEAPDENCPPVV